MRTDRRLLKNRPDRLLVRKLRADIKRSSSDARFLERAVMRFEQHVAAANERAELAKAASIEPLRSGDAMRVMVEAVPRVARFTNAAGDDVLMHRHEYITLTAIPQFAVTINAREIRESRNRYITVEALRRIADAFRDEILKSLTEQSTAHGLLR